MVKNKETDQDFEDTKQIPENKENGEGAESQTTPPKTTKGKRLLLLLIPIILFLIAVGAYFFFFVLGKKDHTKPSSQSGAQDHQVEKFTFIDIENIVVALASGGGKQEYLRISLTVQVKDPAVQEKLNLMLPVVIDNFQTFLRELRPSDLSGSAGVIMLRTELLKRLNKIIAPQEVQDILFKEILMS